MWRITAKDRTLTIAKSLVVSALIFFVCVSASAEYKEGDLLNLTGPQILRLGRQNWLNYVSSKTGSLSHADESIALATYDAIYKDRTLILERNLGKKRRLMFDSAVYGMSQIKKHLDFIEYDLHIQGGNAFDPDSEYLSSVMPVERQGLMALITKSKSTNPDRLNKQLLGLERKIAQIASLSNAKSQQWARFTQIGSPRETYIADLAAQSRQVKNALRSYRKLVIGLPSSTASIFTSYLILESNALIRSLNSG